MNIFIDCGTHLFQGFQKIAETYNIDRTWKCFAFEANPHAYAISLEIYEELSKNFNIEYQNAAVWVSDGTISIDCITDVGEENISQRSNAIRQGHGSEFLYMGVGSIVKENIRSFDFSSFISTVANEKDFVVVKMDIEGSEFYVLPKLIEDGNQKLIDHFYCEFHENFFYDRSAIELKNSIVESLEASGATVEFWS